MPAASPAKYAFSAIWLARIFAASSFQGDKDDKDAEYYRQLREDIQKYRHMLSCR
jgi:hypothetical protein